MNKDKTFKIGDAVSWDQAAWELDTEHDRFLDTCAGNKLGSFGIIIKMIKIEGMIDYFRVQWFRCGADDCFQRKSCPMRDQELKFLKKVG